MILRPAAFEGPDRPTISEAVKELLSADAVRTRCHDIMVAAEHDELVYFQWHPGEMAGIAAYVAAIIQKRFPNLRIPPHSRWRHFEALGHSLAPASPGEPRAEVARRAIDLVTPSVLLDAGTGRQWRYCDPRLGMLGRSEGLAAASLALFTSGALSANPDDPLRTDAERLSCCDDRVLAHAFQVGPDNPLVGLEERASLLRRLGRLLQDHPTIFGIPARLGNLFDHIAAHALDGCVRAPDILSLLLVILAPLWPKRLSQDGTGLGDCWRHPASRDGYVPFHKLTQWLVYSLIEPLEIGGLRVVDHDRLTGLAEYRNGGLLLDMGALTVRDRQLLVHPQPVGSELVVEWRALTVAALDELRGTVSRQLGAGQRFPLTLTELMEGGTWSAGRTVAACARSDGGPPLNILSDGTVF
ncbi:DUF1688 family protein [Acidiferrobacter sp.]